MASVNCPVCGCGTFYCKNPEDEYDTAALRIVDGVALPADPASGGDVLDMAPDTETYCDRCSWHAPFKDVTKR